MKILSFKSGMEEFTGLTGADDVAIAIGPDGQPRIAAHLDKQVWYARRYATGEWRKCIVARASTNQGPVSLPVQDVYGISIASSAYGDVIAGRGRTKGQADQTFHGPWMTVIDPAGIPGRIQSKCFTTGACRAIFDDTNIPWAVELWSKDGNWQTYDIRNLVSSPFIERGQDNIGRTGEKQCRVAGGWSGYGGCIGNPSRIMRRGESPVPVMDGNAYPEIGDDMLYPGMGVRPLATPVVYWLSQYDGLMLCNRVKGGVVSFNPSLLPSIGTATHTPRHAPQLTVSRARMAGFWTQAGQIVGVDIDAALNRLVGPSVICAGSVASTAKQGNDIGMAVIRGGQVNYNRVTTAKGQGS